MPKTLTVPAKFRYVAFYDLLTDAAFHHRLASDIDNSFVMSRHARASVIASALSIECTANCILESVDAPKALRDEIDKLAPLPKIETALRMQGITSFDHGSHVVQKAADLIRARNDYVHPKAAAWEAELHEPEDAGSDWMIPFSIQGGNWKSIDIPKQASFWSKDASLSALRVVCDFFRYLFVEVVKADDEALNRMLPSRLEFADVLMPAVFDEFIQETAALTKDGIDFSFLRGAARQE
ncbi:hypothetical protein RAS12_24090 [Achromobacter seleniivolatilans]|uniref:Uncharacterized protein n=1 Tax=Achromobacter seleniivolatilans TaxID=3047478 RepID=A0ABY9LZF8_9BURK|nr:hypothetical protein [Achromobacter sp. R39]WMD19669.1 hypothetical protein RAS12_24090 [Achromobacter sp. R39]